MQLYTSPLKKLVSLVHYNSYRSQQRVLLLRKHEAWMENGHIVQATRQKSFIHATRVR